MSRVLSVCLSVWVLVGCGDDDGGGGAVGRGSAACQDWQDAICDFVVDRCGSGALTRARCDNQFQGVTCRSDATATACANTFNTVACSTAALAGCDLRDIADPVPARAACETLVGKLCERGIACLQYTSDAECRADVATGGLICDEVAVFTLDYETCLAEVDTLSCTAAMLPAVCERVFLRLQ